MSVSERDPSRLRDELGEPSAGRSGAPDAPVWERFPAFWLAVIALTLIGSAIRLVVAHQPLFADELSTYWIITAHGLRGVVSTVHSNAEITPPLYFVSSWLTAHVSHAPELTRAPSLIAGIATIPIVYLLGLRTVGRRAALVATAIVAFSPFMIYYSAEARGYGVMMAMTTLSTLAMLCAVDSRRRGWWVLYAASSCAAMYTHYTAAFALAAQLVWLLWAHPGARRPALLANAAAVVGFLPWTTGFINDLNSPTSKILSVLSPFTAHDVRLALEHWAVGYPYVGSAGLRGLPGVPALALLALALVIAAVGIARTRARCPPDRRVGDDHRVVLVAGVAVSVIVGEAIVTAVSTNLFGVRNLASAWPFFAVALASLLMAAGPRLRVVAGLVAVAAFAIGAVKMVTPRYGRPDYRAAASFVDRNAAPGDVVIDTTASLSPGPLSPLDLSLKRPLVVVRAAAPAERNRPFGVFDPIVPLSQATPQAVAAAHGRRIFLVAVVFSRLGVLAQRVQTTPVAIPGYRVVQRRLYQGIGRVGVLEYARRGDSAG